jgi:hypothetical protein
MSADVRPNPDLISASPAAPKHPDSASRAPRLSREQIDRLADEIALTSAQIDATTHLLLTRIRAFDECGGWHTQGALSCAHWLTWRAGIGPGAAREQVRVARRLGELPLIDAALCKGEVSYSKVRAMTRVATPETEEVLLHMARSSTAAQLEKICRLYRQVMGVEADPEIEETRRWVRQRGTDDGMVRVTASLHPDEAARLMKAIEVSAEAPGEAARADGIMAMASATLGEVKPRATDHSGSGDMPSCTIRRPAVEAVVKVEIDADTLEGRFEDGAGVSAESCRRLLCDAGVVPAAVDDRGQPLALGRKKRKLSTALRRALVIRDQGCRFPGCANQRVVEAHHVEHWVNGGETTLENTCLLCTRHHKFVHEYGFTIDKAGDGTLVFRDPEGRRVPEEGEAELRRQVSHERMVAALARRGVTPTPMTNCPDWDGSPPDYSATIDVLCQRATRGQGAEGGHCATPG